MLHPFEPGLDQGGELGEVAFGQAGQGPFQARPERFDPVYSRTAGLRADP